MSAYFAITKCERESKLVAAESDAHDDEGGGVRDDGPPAKESKRTALLHLSTMLAQPQPLSPWLSMGHWSQPTSRDHQSHIQSCDGNCIVRGDPLMTVQHFSTEYKHVCKSRAECCDKNSYASAN